MAPEAPPLSVLMWGCWPRPSSRADSQSARRDPAPLRRRHGGFLGAVFVMQIRGTRKTSPGLGARRAADSSGEDSLSGPSITSTTERLVPQGGTGPSVRDPTPRRSSGDPRQQSVWFTRSSSTSSTTCCCCCCWTGSEGNLPARKRGPVDPFWGLLPEFSTFVVSLFCTPSVFRRLLSFLGIYNHTHTHTQVRGHEPGGGVPLLRAAAGLPGGGEEGQHQGAALAAAEHDELRGERELLRTRGPDGAAPVGDRREPGARQAARQVRRRHPPGQPGGLERPAHRRVRGPPGHCAVPDHQGQVLLGGPVMAMGTGAPACQGNTT